MTPLLYSLCYWNIPSLFYIYIYISLNLVAIFFKSKFRDKVPFRTCWIHSTITFLTSAAASLVLLTKVIFLFVTTSMALLIAWKSSDNIDLHKAHICKINYERVRTVRDATVILHVTLRYVTFRFVSFRFLAYGFRDAAVMFVCLKVIASKLRIHHKYTYLDPLISFFWGAEKKNAAIWRWDIFNSTATLRVWAFLKWAS